MSKRTRRARFSFTGVWVLAWLTMGVALGQRSFAQAPGGPVQGQNQKKIYTNKQEFHLPVRLPEEHRASLKEMCLYVKSAQFDWTRQDSVPPNGTRFTYHVPLDGEYFFTVVTVDKSGRPIPSDVRTVQPGLRVVVDTQPPQFEVRSWISPEGETYLKCIMIDANPNPESIRVTFRNTAGIETVAEPFNNQPGLFRITGPETCPVRITGIDLAQNQTTQELNARELLGEKFAAVQPTLPGAVRPDLQAPPPGPPANPITSAGYTPDQNRLPPIISSKGNDLPAPPPSIGKVGEPVLPATGPSFPPSVSLPGDNLPKIPALSSGPAGNRQIIRSTQASVDYRIEGAGTSGVGKVEVYFTADEGQTWKRLKEDVNRRSPVAIELPGEGLFGISVAITNGNGFGGTPPKRGDAPAFWVEVDATSPFVQLRPIEVSTSTGGTIEIRWTATDKNLHAEPIHLYYRTRQDGPWQSIAHNVKNEGIYRWSIPRDVGNQFFFKIEAIDQAGNVGRAETTSAVVLDMSEPRGVILGVTSSAPPAGSPQGN